MFSVSQALLFYVILYYHFMLSYFILTTVLCGPISYHYPHYTDQKTEI